MATLNGIRFWVYYYNSTQKLWLLDQTSSNNYVMWTPGPNSIAVKRKVEWKLKSTGTKQLKVFKFKGRQVGTVTLTGKVGTILYKKLEYLSVSKIVLDVRAQYTEPGDTITFYPLISPVVPYLGTDTPLDLTDEEQSSNIAYETNSFYIITEISGKMQGYAVMDHPTGSSSKRETVIEISLKLERVDEGKIFPATYPPW